MVNAKNGLALKKFRGYRRGMENAKQILDTIGRQRIADALGVKIIRVHRAAYGEQLPAVWFAALCELSGQELPRHLFSFKGVSK